MSEDNKRSLGEWATSWIVFQKGDVDGKPVGTWIIVGNRGFMVGFEGDDFLLARNDNEQASIV